MNILIDADGCPVVDLTLQIAKRFGISVIILCDTAHQIERKGAQTLVFDKGADSVDFALVNRVKPGDVVVTQDYGLASMCLAKCARVLNQNGLEYTADNIDALMLRRYSEEEIKAVLEGKAKHQPYQKQPPKEQPFQLLVDIQGKMAQGKSVGYKKWATKFNLKEMSKTLLFLQEQKIGSAEELRESAAAATERYHAMGDSIKAAEARLTEIAVLKTHIINYAKTREVYAAYRKAGYSKAFLEAHREEITLHKAAKAAFDEAGLQKLPKVKELDAEFAELLTKKKAAYPDYRKARNEMQELARAQKNVERFFAEEKDTTEKTQTR